MIPNINSMLFRILTSEDAYFAIEKAEAKVGNLTITTNIDSVLGEWVLKTGGKPSIGSLVSERRNYVILQPLTVWFGNSHIVVSLSDEVKNAMSVLSKQTKGSLRFSVSPSINDILNRGYAYSNGEIGNAHPISVSSMSRWQIGKNWDDFLFVLQMGEIVDGDVTSEDFTTISNTIFSIDMKC